MGKIQHFKKNLILIPIFKILVRTLIHNLGISGHQELDFSITFKVKCILRIINAYMSRLMGKPTICIGEYKDADQLRGDREADQHLCFRYSESTVPLLLKSEISRF